MMSKPEAERDWGNQYRLVASERWKAKSAAMGQPVTDALVEYAQPRPGMHVIDLASGTGEPAITLASRVGPQGHVTAIDLSADLLEIAEKRAQSRRLTNFSTHKTDAHALPFADDSFDLGTSRFGVMFFRDPQKRWVNCGGFCGLVLAPALWPGAASINLIGAARSVRYTSLSAGLCCQRMDRIHFDSRALAACQTCCGLLVSTPSKKKHELYRGPGQALPKNFGSR